MSKNGVTFINFSLFAIGFLSEQVSIDLLCFMMHNGTNSIAIRVNYNLNTDIEWRDTVPLQRDKQNDHYFRRIGKFLT